MTIPYHTYLSAILLLLLFFCALRDWKQQIIPNIYLIRGAAIRVLLLPYDVSIHGVEGIKIMGIKVLCSPFIFGAGILVRKMTRNGIGMGDIKLFCLMFFYLPLEEWVQALLYSSVIGGIIAAAVWIQSGKNKKVPFAPMIFAGTMCAILL